MTDRNPIDCEEALARLAAYLDDELGEERSDEVRHHLETCRSCFSRAEFERRLKERVRQDLKVDTVPADLEERVRGLLQDLSGPG